MKEGSLSTGLSMPAAADVVDEKGSEYILVHTGPRKLYGHPLGGVWVGVSSENYACIYMSFNIR